MKLEKTNNNEKNIFEKYYLPKSQEEKNKKIDNLDYISFLSSTNKKPVTEKEDVEISNVFTKIFYNSIIPYLLPKDLISFKLCNKITNSFISNKAINICIMSKSTKNFISPNEREKIWNHYLKMEKYYI